MKNPKSTLVLLLVLITLLYACTDELIVEESNRKLTSEFSEKASALKLSYIEEAIRSSEFPEGKAMELGLTFMEEPKSTKMRVYIEVYEDLTFTKETTYLPSNNGFPADEHQAPEDMPRVKRYLYQNGVTKGYDKNGQEIFEEQGGETYFMEPSSFESTQKAMDFIKNNYVAPLKNAQLTLDRLKENNSWENIDNTLLKITNTFDVPQNYTSSSRVNADNDIVTIEKRFYDQQFGLLIRTEGYTSNNELKDMEHNFYAYTADSVLYLQSSHYINKEVLSAYDIAIEEKSDIFYSDFKFESTF